MSVFHARILASDALFFDGDCEFMVVPCTDGAMGILSHHSNMIAAVVPGELRFPPGGGRRKGGPSAKEKYAGAPERGGPAGPGHQPSADQRTLEQRTLSHENT